MRVGIGLGTCEGGDDGAAAARASAQASEGVPHPDLVLAFAGVRRDQKKIWKALSDRVDPAVILGGSSYAEITPAGVTKDSIAVLHLDLEGARVSFGSTRMGADARRTGVRLAAAVRAPKGSRTLGLMFGAVATGYENLTLKTASESLGGAAFFGGMCSGDYDLGTSAPGFWKSWQYAGGELHNKAARLALLELPKSWRASFGCEHGWDPVAPPARLTRCVGSDVYELDGMPILDYYRQFLGGQGLRHFFKHMVQRYAFAVRPQGSERTLIRLPVGANFEKGFVTYYPAEELQGREVQLIQSSRTGLITGARTAARRCLAGLGGKKPQLVLMVSCCTRASILHSRLDRELQAVREVFGPGVPVFGYYSGGEIGPLLTSLEQACPGPEPLAGSFYHTTTICLLALTGDGPAAVSAPKTAARCDEAPILRAQLRQSEDIFDDTERFLSSLTRKSYEDGERLRKQNEVIHRYTPHEVWKEVGERAARGVFELEDRAFVGAFMFMDVKGFTSYSETHAPGEVVRALNELFDPATRLIYEHGGDVDKYIGDCIFSAFNNPRDAARCGLKILGAFAALAKKGNPFTVRIGVNAGRAVRANVGSGSRREYTFIGDAVNLTQRLESNAAPGAMLVSDAVYTKAKALLKGAKRRSLTVKGKKEPVTAWEVGG
ncbi:MAG: FIST C-terminal domain-containing protein [Elusimicrobia bacterium]|nr:FIST C-terminal domain-containing protein [Elusimicrobiota bacterium]